MNFKERIREASDEELPTLYEELYRGPLKCRKDEEGCPIKLDEGGKIQMTHFPNSYSFIRTLIKVHAVGFDLIELGCGCSSFPFIMATDGYNVKAIDLRDVVVENLKKHLSVLSKEVQDTLQFECALAENLPYEDDSFDIIVGVDFLEHIRDLDRLLRECTRVLRPNRNMYFSIPMGGINWSPEHLHDFNRENIKSLFNKHNFEVNIYEERYYWSETTPRIFIVEVYNP